jgi:single-stranded-DNA-specific exonuclease
LKLFLRQEMHERDAIFFGGGETALPEPPWDMAFTIDRNVFRGRTSLQLTVRELRSSKPG